MGKKVEIFRKDFFFIGNYPKIIFVSFPTNVSSFILDPFCFLTDSTQLEYKIGLRFTFHALFACFSVKLF